MSGRTIARIPAWLLLAAATSLPGSAAGNGSPERPGMQLDPRTVPWSELRFSTRKFGISATSDISLAPADRQAGGAPGALTLAIDSAYVGRLAHAEATFDPKTAAVSSSATGRLGKRGYYKSYRFLPAGLALLRRAPATSAEEQLEPDHWTRIETKSFSFPPGTDKCPVISEAAVLFYVLSAAPAIEIGKSREICMVSGTTPYDVVITARGRESLPVDYEMVSGDTVRSVSTRVDALELVIDARPIDGSPGDDFSFLGLEGAMTLHLDTELGAPLRVRGRLPLLGNVRIKLKRMVLVEKDAGSEDPPPTTRTNTVDR